MNRGSPSSLRCLSKKETTLLELIHALLGSTSRSRRVAPDRFILLPDRGRFRGVNVGAVVAEMQGANLSSPRLRAVVIAAALEEGTTAPAVGGATQTDQASPAAVAARHAQ
jgi:hypothetical protein